MPDFYDHLRDYLPKQPPECEMNVQELYPYTLDPTIIGIGDGERVDHTNPECVEMFRCIDLANQLKLSFIARCYTNRCATCWINEFCLGD